MTEYLLDIACKKNYNIALIFDHDEFFCVSGNKNQLTLSETIQKEFTKYDHLKVQSYDYIGERSHRNISISSLANFKKVQLLKKFTLFKLKIWKFEFELYLKPLHKNILKLNTKRSSMKVSLGNHYAFGKGFQSKKIHIKHLPYADFESIKQRYRQKLNFSSVNLRQGLAYEARTFNIVTENQVEEFWNKNTYYLVNGTTTVDVNDQSMELIALKCQKLLSQNHIRSLQLSNRSKYSNEEINFSKRLDLIGENQIKYDFSAKTWPTRIIRFLARTRLQLSKHI